MSVKFQVKISSNIRTTQLVSAKHTNRSKPLSVTHTNRSNPLSATSPVSTVTDFSTVVPVSVPYNQCWVRSSVLNRVRKFSSPVRLSLSSVSNSPQNSVHRSVYLSSVFLVLSAKIYSVKRSVTGTVSAVRKP